MTEVKKILILSRREERSDYDNAERLVGKLMPSKRGIIYQSNYIEDLGFLFDGQQLRILTLKDGRDISEYDGLFLLGWFLRPNEDLAHAAALYMRSRGKPVLNKEAITTRSRSKISQYALAILNDIPMVPFAFTINRAYWPELLKIANIRFPVIAKAFAASKGRFNYLVDNPDELQPTIDGAPDKAFIVQERILNDGDFRLIVMGEEVRLIIHRQAQTGSHLNNTSQGGKATIVPADSLNPQILKDSVRIAKLLGREICGVDIIIDRATGKHFFLEANNLPQLSTGSYVAHKAELLDDFLAEWVNS